MDLQNYYELIEKAIENLGVDPATVREKTGQWNLKKGSAVIYINVWNDEKNQDIYFQASSTVARIPENNKEAFFSEILDINAKIFGVTMGKIDPWIFVRHVREMKGLDESEIITTINRVANYSDIYDDYLKEKYSL
ncbi:MAG: YbjN domain-containing protein [Bacteroidales bacterium]|nr:YbjN domain-containing protein [Bacteroidales bacterium]